MAALKRWSRTGNRVRSHRGPAPSRGRGIGPACVGLLVLGALLVSTLSCSNRSASGSGGSVTSDATTTGSTASTATATTAAPRWEAAEVHVLTSEGGTIGVSTDGVAAVARGVAGGDARVVWAGGGSAAVNEESCATWDRIGPDGSQPGVALRVRIDGQRVRAVTVTNNVLRGLRWAFNVHVWDTDVRGPDGSPTLRQVGRLGLGETFYRDGYVPLPWRLCARVVGAEVSILVWPLSDPEPDWDDPRYGGSVTLPAEFVYAGRPGWYAGHLGVGEEIAQSDQIARSITRSRSSPGSTQEPPS